MTVTDGVVPGTAYYTVLPNLTSAQRTGVIALGGFPSTVLYPITQGGGTSVPPAPSPGPSCFNGVFPSGVSLTADGGQRSITVSAPDGCNWTASSNAAWVTLATAAGAGSVMLGYTVAPNPSTAARTATLTVGTATFLVTEDVAGNGGGDGHGGGGTEEVARTEAAVAEAAVVATNRYGHYADSLVSRLHYRRGGPARVVCNSAVGRALVDGDE